MSDRPRTCFLLLCCTVLTQLCACADQWEVQETVQRIVHELQRREYLVWFDLDVRVMLSRCVCVVAVSLIRNASHQNMKGNTVDAMSDAIDSAEVVLFGVSLKYKESANCRLEANCEAGRCLCELGLVSLTKMRCL